MDNLGGRRKFAAALSDVTRQRERRDNDDTSELRFSDTPISLNMIARKPV
jgi:hypothetical protein